MAGLFHFSVGGLPITPSSGITALFKGRNSKKCFARSLGQEIHRMQEKQVSFGEEETASHGVFASLYLKQEVC